MLGRTERRLALVILLTATIPLVAAVMLANSLFKQASKVWLNPDVDVQLERGVSLHKDFVRAVKDDMKHQTDAIANSPILRHASTKPNAAALSTELEKIFPQYPELVSLAVQDNDGNNIAIRDRGTPLNEQTERSLDVRRPLGDRESAPTLVATYSFDRRYEEELKRAGTIRDTYQNLEKDREQLYSGYFRAFALLLSITMIATVVLGFLLARGVTRRINRLANAINLVAAGDLDVRVPVTGSDEITELSRVFNRMLGEMQQSRARIEYLQRIGAWQEMAQKLAHEIKNPLTPIQLAVQECHRKYAGEDGKYRTLLDTTLEIVEEEVGTLRRLVGNFSSFARLPHADLRKEDLREFLRECSEQLGYLEGAAIANEEGTTEPLAANVEVEWELPGGDIPAFIDRQMLRLVLNNLVRNAAQAIRDQNTGEGASKSQGRVRIRAEGNFDGARIDIDDNGPGIPDQNRSRVFDPYFTTKEDGTGLGLAIVKKIVVEHGGTVEVTRSSALGGARFTIRLPSVRAGVPPAPESAALLNDGPSSARTL